MTSLQQARDDYVFEYAKRRPELPAIDRPWVHALRTDAIERFETLGFPAAKNEDWKYTRVTPILDLNYRVVDPDAAAADRARIDRVVASLPGVADCPLLVFVDGCFIEQASRMSGAGVTVEPLAAKAKGRAVSAGGVREAFKTRPGLLKRHLGKYLETTHGFAALNTAFMEDGYLIKVGKGMVVESPLHVVFINGSTGRRGDVTVTYPRNVLVAAAGSSATVVEHYVGEAGSSYLTNAVTEIKVAKGATLNYCRLQDESHEAYHVGRVDVHQSAASSFTSHTITTGAALSRTEVKTRLAGEQAECRLFGLYATRGEQHADHHTVIDHAMPRTRSHQLYKGVLDDSSRGVFTGRVIVRPDAQQIEADQRNNNLLLAEGAVAETRPQLEIYADDVKCSHGATIGRLDEDAMFYLRQRGIGQAEARSLMTYAFGSEVLASIGAADLGKALQKSVLGRLAKAVRPGANK